MFGDEVSFDGIDLPVKELIKVLEESKNKELGNFAKWIKEQSESCSPRLLCLNLSSPDLVGYQYYSTRHLENMNDDFDADKWREYRNDYDGDLITFDYDYIDCDAVDMMNSTMDEGVYDEDEEDEDEE